MLAMDQIHRIRQLFYEQVHSISEIARITGFNWKTVSKYVDEDNFNDPNPMPAQTKLCPKFEPYKKVIDSWLEEDKTAPRKQRHTSKRVYRRLRIYGSDPFELMYFYGYIRKDNVTKKYAGVWREYERRAMRSPYCEQGYREG